MEPGAATGTAACVGVNTVAADVRDMAMIAKPRARCPHRLPVRDGYSTGNDRAG